MAGYWEKMKESMNRYKGKIHPVDEIAYKLKAYMLADQVGIEHAEILKVYKKIENINWEDLPDRFVIKPQQGCSGNGVFPLIRKNGKYRDILRDKEMTKEEIIEIFKEGITAKKSHSKKIWIEELLSDNLPYDWKVHTFNGRIGIIEQFKRDGKGKYHKYWTREWKPINDMCKKIFTYEINNNLLSPEHPESLLTAAKLLSKAIGHPFVRIDLYDTPRGVFIGEITPHPGRTCIYQDYWEKKLGKMWEKAERELNGRGI